MYDCHSRSRIHVRTIWHAYATLLSTRAARVFDMRAVKMDATPRCFIQVNKLMLKHNYDLYRVRFAHIYLASRILCLFNNILYKATTAVENNHIRFPLILGKKRLGIFSK